MTQDNEQMTSASLSAKSNDSLSSVNSKAEENLAFIRSAMEGASAFTSISGKGLVFTGLVGLFAAWLELTSNQSPSLMIWLSALVVAVIGSVALTMRKAQLQGTTLWSASGRKLTYAFTPTMVVGGIVTYFMASADLTEMLPGFWLALYGAAVMTAGAHSIGMIKLVGAVFILLAVFAFAAPAYSLMALALGFGGVHLSAGYLVWKYYGG